MSEERAAAAASEGHAQYEGMAIDRLRAFALLSGDEKERLASMALPRRTLSRGKSIRQQDVARGEGNAMLHLLLDGWAATAITFPDGSRQLTSVSLPGDLLGLPSLSVAEPIDTLIALNSVTVCDIPARRFAEMFVEMPRLAMILFLVSQEERMLAMERLALVGRASAGARLAALFLRLQERLSRDRDDLLPRFPLPLTQVELGDLIGVSAVHINALLKQAREEGVVVIEDRELSVLDQERLVEIAGVQPWRRADPNWLRSEGDA